MFEVHAAATGCNLNFRTWSARTWTTFVAQRISVALHRAAALEILQSLRMGPVEGRDLY